jgi:hypothetical protein
MVQILHHLILKNIEYFMILSLLIQMFFHYLGPTLVKDFIFVYKN